MSLGSVGNHFWRGTPPYESTGVDDYGVNMALVAMGA